MLALASMQQMVFWPARGVGEVHKCPPSRPQTCSCSFSPALPSFLFLLALRCCSASLTA